jgi:hypothetical protein
MSLNPAYQPTVSWLPELAPTLDAREAAREMFEQQTGHPPAAFYGDSGLGIWGFVAFDAVLLFAVPIGWTAATGEPSVDVTRVEELLKREEPPPRPQSSSLRRLHRVTA